MMIKREQETNAVLDLVLFGAGAWLRFLGSLSMAVKGLSWTGLMPGSGARAHHDPGPGAGHHLGAIS